MRLPVHWRHQQLNTERLRKRIVDVVGRGIPAQVQEDCLTPSLVAILEDAKERARDAGCCLAGTEHLLLAIIPRPLFQCSHHSEEVGCQSEPALHALQQRHCLWGANGTKPYGYPFPQKLSGTVSVRKADDRSVKSLPL